MHLSVHALLQGLAGGGKGAPRAVAGPPSAASAEAEGKTAPESMEALAAILGPPQGKFVPPCRMQH